MKVGSDPIAQLLARDQHGIKFGLENIRALCDALERPERAWASVIVAGTNGKGSVTAMAASGLTAAGYRTGRYTSPHLVSIEERFAIDGQMVERPPLEQAATRVMEAEARCLARGTLRAPVTFFEITTATAFELFRAAAVDIVVLEVGMGGRFDATNAAEPRVGAITSIAFDHMRFLGDTLAEIAFEKVGIARPRCPIVVGPLPPDADAVIRRVAAERGAPVIDALEGVHFARVLTSDGRTALTLETPAHNYGTFTLALRGHHQAMNAIVAVRLLETVAGTGMAVEANAVVRGLTEVAWPGRLQQIDLPGGRRVVLDAAHNPAGAATLARYLTEVHAPPATIVFGAMRDKDSDGMLQALAPHAERFIFTQAHSHRAAAARDLAARAAGLGLRVPTSWVDSPGAALEAALTASSLVVVTGSIFVIGDLLPSVEARAGSGASSACGMLRAGDVKGC